MVILCIYPYRQYEVLEARKFVNFKIYVALQNGSYGNFARMLEFRHIKSNVATHKSYL